jgi:DNA-binding NarL/FixJ family response regulator
LRRPGGPARPPRARRVPEPAAEGRSNPSIARELFVTRKTVEFHLSNAFRKLGVRRREELGEALRPSDA